MVTVEEALNPRGLHLARFSQGSQAQVCASQIASYLTLRSVRGPTNPATRWVGNRNGYESARGTELLAAFRSALSPDDQFRTFRAIAEFYVSELPAFPVYYAAYHVGAVKKLRAMEDYRGGGNDHGTYTRNAHLWELR